MRVAAIGLVAALATLACSTPPAPDVLEASTTDVRVDDVVGVEVAPPDAVADTGPDATPDAVPIDTPLDTAPEAAPDAPASDSGPDAAPDASDAADGGGSFPDLATMYASEGYQVLYLATCSTAGCDAYEKSEAMAPTSCRVTAGVLTFSLRACTPRIVSLCDTATGRLELMGGGAPSLSVRNAGGNTSNATAARVTSGPRYFVGGVARQSHHVQFAAPAMAPATGATGIVGRTVAPDRGDIWLLGCQTD